MMRLLKQILLVLFVVNYAMMGSNKNIPGYYEADVSPHYLAIELKADSTFKIIDAGDLYPKRATTGNWSAVNDSVIVINSTKQNYPMKEYGKIENDSMSVKVVDSAGIPIMYAWLTVKYKNGEAIGALTDSTGTCKISHYGLPVELIQVYDENGMFGNTFMPDKIFNGNILIKYRSTQDGSIIKNQYYYYRKDSLISLGDVYEYYDFLKYLVFHRTNDVIKFMEGLEGERDYFRDRAMRNFFDSENDSTGADVFPELGMTIDEYIVKIRALYNDNKNIFINQTGLNSYYKDYYNNLDDLFKFYKHKPDQINDPDFRKYVGNFRTLLEDIYLKLENKTK